MFSSEFQVFFFLWHSWTTDHARAACQYSCFLARQDSAHICMHHGALCGLKVYCLVVCRARGFPESLFLNRTALISQTLTVLLACCTEENIKKLVFTGRNSIMIYCFLYFFIFRSWKTHLNIKSDWIPWAVLIAWPFEARPRNPITMGIKGELPHTVSYFWLWPRTRPFLSFCFHCVFVNVVQEIAIWKGKFIPIFLFQKYLTRGWMNNCLNCLLKPSFVVTRLPETSIQGNHNMVTGK